MHVVKVPTIDVRSRGIGTGESTFSTSLAGGTLPLGRKVCHLKARQTHVFNSFPETCHVVMIFCILFPISDFLQLITDTAEFTRRRAPKERG